MRVQMAVRGFDYGFGSHTLPLVAALSDQGIDVHVTNMQSDSGMLMRRFGSKIRPD